LPSAPPAPAPSPFANMFTGRRITVNLGDSFDLVASLAALDEICAQGGRQLDPRDMSMHDANSSAYGGGVARQWLLDLAKGLLDSKVGLVIESQCERHQVEHDESGGGGGGGAGVGAGASAAPSAAPSAGASAGGSSAGGGSAGVSSTDDGAEAVALVPGATVKVEGAPDPRQLNGLVGVALSFSDLVGRWVVRFDPEPGTSSGGAASAASAGPARTEMIEATYLKLVKLHDEQKSKVKARWTAVRALTRFLLRKHRQKMMHVEQVVSLSPLSDPVANQETSRRLRAFGRVLGATLVRKEPIGFALSDPFCKLLTGQKELITWEDLESVLPGLQFAPLAACLEPDLSPEQQQEKLAYFVEYGLLIYEEDGEEATFTRPSRAARRYSIEHPTAIDMPADLRQSSTLEDDGDISAVTTDNVSEFAAAWAQKELVANTEDQVAAVLHGIADVRGADSILTHFFNAGGWQALQRQVRGELDIDVAEWRQTTTHMMHRGGRNDIAARDNFWDVVAKISAEDRIKLLQYWCSKLPPAGGVRALGRNSQYPITLVFEAVGAGDACLPQAATCFHQMVIPSTPDRAKMAEVVANAVAHYKDFGLT